MAQKTLPPSASSAIVGVIEPDATAIGTHTTGWISAADFQALMAIVLVGALGAGATVDAKIEQAKDSAGADLKDVENAAIEQLTKVDADDNKQAVIELWGEDLDIKEGFAYVRLSVTVGGANSDLSAVVLGSHPRQGPAFEHQLTSVDEIVTV